MIDECLLNEDGDVYFNSKEIKTFHFTKKGNVSSIERNGLKTNLDTNAHWMDLIVREITGSKFDKLSADEKKTVKYDVRDQILRKGTGVIFGTRGIQNTAYIMRYMGYDNSYELIGVKPEYDTFEDHPWFNDDLEVVSFNDVSQKGLCIVSNWTHFIK